MRIVTAQGVTSESTNPQEIANCLAAGGSILRPNGTLAVVTIRGSNLFDPNAYTVDGVPLVGAAAETPVEGNAIVLTCSDTDGRVLDRWQGAFIDAMADPNIDTMRNRLSLWGGQWVQLNVWQLHNYPTPGAVTTLFPISNVPDGPIPSAGAAENNGLLIAAGLGLLFLLTRRRG